MQIWALIIAILMTSLILSGDTLDVIDHHDFHRDWRSGGV
jgi:hypothetical protein